MANVFICNRFSFLYFCCLIPGIYWIMNKNIAAFFLKSSLISFEKTYDRFNTY